MTMAMFGGAIRLARPRATAAALSVSPSLSHLFSSSCNLSTSDTSAVSSRPITISAVASTVPIQTVAKRTLTPYQSGRQQNQTNKIRWFSSESKDDPPPPTDNPDTISGSSQHDAWVQFQRSIAVSGFDTGQTVKERTLGKKSRGGEMSRKRKEREADAEAALKGVDVTQLKGGEFPELRYSDEETDRLLAEAYAAIPPRAGKRGTLHLKREKRRWFIKRQYDYKKKRERIAAHGKRLEKMTKEKADIKSVRVESKDIRERDLGYHDEVLQRWAEMSGHNAALLELEEPRKKELVSLGWKL